MHVKNYKWRLNAIWQRMLYSCTNMTTEGIKGLIINLFMLQCAHLLSLFFLLTVQYRVMFFCVAKCSQVNVFHQ